METMAFVSTVLGEFKKAVFNNAVFWVVLAIVAFQYHKISKNRENMFGIKGNSVLKDTAIATLFGILGGLIGTFLLILTGINITGLGIAFIWPLALLLMLINPRFICFSYAGGLVAISNLLFGFPKVDIPQLMGLIAILHLVESILISISGHQGGTPVFAKTPSGRIVGGFTLQKFWPLPIVAVAFLTDAVNYTVLPQMPDWWPVIKLGYDFFPETTGFLIPFVAGVGYGDIAIAHTPAEKSKMSARNLSLFSIILLVLAVLATRYDLFLYLASIFAPLGHEAVIYIGQNSELKGRPVFVPPIMGVRVLEAVPNTPASKLGIKSGDIIYSVNGIILNSKRDLEMILWENPLYLEIDYITFADEKWHRAATRLKAHQPFGIIAVPEENEAFYVEFKNQYVINSAISKIKKIFNLR